MRHGIGAVVGALAVAIVVVASSSSTVAGQAPSTTAKANPATAEKYAPPRTPEGHPDFQGVWAMNDATPFQRPKELEGRQFLTEEEVTALKKRARELFNGETDATFGDSVFLAVLRDVQGKDLKTEITGNYNHFWIVDREFDNRTSVISDPPDGRIPELTAAAKKWKAAEAKYREKHPADGPEDLSLGHRCVTYGVPRLGAGYNSYFQIVQTKDYVAVLQEMIHEVRLIPLDGRPHLPASVRQWNGDSRGRWEGDTLVIETKNFSPKARLREGENLPSDNLHLVERFTRVGPKTIEWNVVVNNPVMYTRRWTATVMLRHSPDQIYEVACHEGNKGMPGTLSGHRALERKAAEAAAKTSN